MQRAVLQIPIDQQIKEEAERAAKAQGFSSLQEVVRVFLNKLAKRGIWVTFEETVQLSKQAARRYDKMAQDIEKGKVKTKTFTDVTSLMKHLEQ